MGGERVQVCVGRDRTQKQIASKFALKRAKSILEEEAGLRGKMLFLDIDASVLSCDWQQVGNIDVQFNGNHIVRWSEAACEKFGLDRATLHIRIEGAVRRQAEEPEWV